MISEWQLMIQAQASASKSATIEYFRVFGSFFTTQYLPITWGAGLRNSRPEKAAVVKISLPKFNSVSSHPLSGRQRRDGDEKSRLLDLNCQSHTQALQLKQKRQFRSSLSPIPSRVLTD